MHESERKSDTLKLSTNFFVRYFDFFYFFNIMNIITKQNKADPQ